MMVDALGVAPERCIYLDDIGVNLKPAAPWALPPSR
jgi:putative hydrolase of the HAD superfamily